MNMPSECSKMRSESSEYMWKTTGTFINSWRTSEKIEEDHVVEYVQSNVDGDDSEGTSRTTQRE